MSQTQRLHSVIVLLFAGYLVVALWFPLFPHYDQVPVADVRTFAPTPLDGALYAALVSALFAGCWAGARLVRRVALTPRTAALVTLAFGLPLLFTYPINANDVFRYYLQGRVTVHHRANPLAVPLNAFPDDPYLPLGGEWVAETSPYGPVWEGVDAAVYWLSGGDLFAALVLFKLVGLLLHVALGLLLWAWPGAAPPSVRRERLILWLWNPALLLMFVVDAHNDVMMLLWLLLGAWLTQRGRPLAGLWLMVLAPLTKLIGIVVVPFYAVDALRRLPTWGARLRLTAAVAAAWLVTTVVAFLPFGSPLALLARLARESQLDGGFSPLAFVILAARRLYFDPPVALLVQAALVLFVVVALGLLVGALRGRRPEQGSAEIFLAYLFTAFKFRIWYTTWPWAWLLLDDARPAARRLGFIGLWTAQVSVIVYAHVRRALFAGDVTAAHLLGVPFVFATPLLVGLWWVLRRRYGTVSGVSRT